MKRIPDIKQELRIKFWNNVDVRDLDSCWEWKKSLTHNGYGKLGYGRFFFRSHRIAYFLHYGHDPVELHVLHSCDNRKCCNPKHLRLGTNTDNRKDMVDRGRACRGEDNWKAILTADDVKSIREGKGKIFGKVLAEQYNTTVSNISSIQTKRNWKHV